LNPEEVVTARKLIDEIYVDERVSKYIVDLVIATREPESYGLSLEHLIQYGASPRASINLTLAAKANAFLAGRGYVTPQDVKDMAYDVLRHRVILTYEAEAEELTSVDVIDKILGQVQVP
jgi:MoxR-like ATPase